jgi:hypothetical protein
MLNENDINNIFNSQPSGDLITNGVTDNNIAVDIWDPTWLGGSGIDSMKNIIESHGALHNYLAHLVVNENISVNGLDIETANIIRSEFVSTHTSSSIPVASGSNPGGYPNNEESTGFIVSGAGASSGANGTYCLFGTNEGKSKYSLVGSDNHFVIQYTNDWRPGSGDGYGPTWLIIGVGNILYYTSSSVETPPSNGWQIFSGASPVPTLSSTTCS